MNMVALETRSKQAIFSKWLPRPNHYAHDICIEFLSRTMVSVPNEASMRRTTIGSTIARSVCVCPPIMNPGTQQRSQRRKIHLGQIAYGLQVILTGGL